MTILYDARGNEFKGEVDVITNETLTDARSSTASLSALNAEAVVDIQGKRTISFDIRTGAANLTLVFEGTLDGTNYFTLTGFNETTFAPTQAVIITTTHAQKYNVNCTGFRRVRCRVSAFTSGSVTIGLRGTEAEFSSRILPRPSDNINSSTAAVNTALTTTLAAAGAGLYHYITKIEIVKLYNVVGVAAGAGTIITTTNLNGLAWTTEQLASAAGTAVTVVKWENEASPLKSQVANTNTTIVAPAQLQTIWRINVLYYIGD